MYLVDCYEGLSPALILFDHATFVSFFPYVISGPIAKSKRMVHQFDNFGGVPDERSTLIARGLYQFSIGLFKKVILADAFASIANLGFGTGSRLSAAEAWIFSVCYTMQIYFDFSGYSDMAIGSAMMLSVEVPRNFDAPLRSKSIIEFWQRWHISLTNFITTYLYTPILKKFERATLTASAISTLIAMTIAGLWHGPSWTFVAYGAIHGCGLAINQFWRKKKMPKIPAFASWLLDFCSDQPRLDLFPVEHYASGNTNGSRPGEPTPYFQRFPGDGRAKFLHRQSDGRDFGGDRYRVLWQVFRPAGSGV